MSEALIRWLADRLSMAFLLLLVSLVGVLVFGFIKGDQFMVGFLSLMAGFFGACHFAPVEKSVG